MTADTEQRASLLKGSDTNRYSSIDVAAVQPQNDLPQLKIEGDETNCLSSRRATAKVNLDAVGVRGSIFQPKVASMLPQGEAVGTKAQSVMIQAVIFAIMVLSSGMTPAINMLLMGKKGDGSRQTKFHHMTPYLIDFLLSVTLANIISFFLHGVKGWKDCWNPKAIALFAPTAIMATVSESFTTKVLQFLDGTTFRLIKQLKLPLTAIGVYFVLRRKSTTSTQWSLIVAMTVCIMGYFVLMAGDKWTPGRISPLGLYWAALVLVTSVAGSLLADFTYKKIQFPLIIQIPQVRVTNFVVCLSMLIIICCRNHCWRQVFLLEGWNINVLLFTLFLVAKDWISTFVFKHMDSLWKAIGGALSLCVTYIMDIIMDSSKFNVGSFMFVVAVVVNIIAFSLTKRDAARLKKASEAKQA